MKRLLPTLALLGACTQMGPPADSPPVSVSHLLEAAGENLDAALAAFDEGNIDSGESRMRLAVTLADQAGDACANGASCDTAALVGVYRRIVDAQSSLFSSPVSDEPAEAAESPPAVSSASLEAPRAGADNGFASKIPLNQLVLAEIHDWLTWNRPHFMQSYENYQFLRPLMIDAYEGAGLPEALLFGIIAVESGGRAHSYSRVGAAGPLQFMRATAERFGLDTRGEFDERLDAARAVEANVAYLVEYYERLGSWEKTLAAYNSGENRILGMNRRLGRPDFWSPSFFSRLPRDTQTYVPQVLAAAWLFLHPERYDLVLPSFEAQIVDLTLVRPMSLSEVTICTGNEVLANGWFRTLRNLNPAVEPEERIEAGQTLRVPQMLVPAFAARCEDTMRLADAAVLFEANYGDVQALVPYRIRRGETLSRIASRLECVSMRELAEINDIRPPRYLIREGKVIQVPNC